MEKGGWVNRLWLHIGEKTDGGCGIYNLSISGGTIETTLERFESEAGIREADGLIFQLGGNDSCFAGKNGPNLVPFEKFRNNLEEIIRRAGDIAQNIIFIGFSNVDESKTAPVPWTNVYYANTEIKKYNEAIKSVCESRGIPFLDVFGLLDIEDFEDGLHPNAIGHKKIFMKVRDFLAANSWV